MHLYTPPKAAENIPVIDLSPSFSGDLEDRRKVAWEIHKTARDTGFFYVSGHGVDQALMDEHLEWAARFFDLPLEEKRALDSRNQDSTRGYEGMGAQTLDEGSPPDLKEGFMVSVEADENHRYTRLGVPGTGPNQWPDLPGFREHMESYNARVIALGQHVARLVALSLELPEDYFDETLKEPLFYSRLLKYPPHPKDAAPNQLGAGAHTDWGMLTFLLQDDIGGLEVQNRAGEWVAAPPIKGTYVVNFGAMIPVLTNGYYNANMHRVLNNSSSEVRYSAPVFVDPDYDYYVECVPTLKPENGKLDYQPMTAGEHMRSMFEKTFGKAA